MTTAKLNFTGGRYLDSLELVTLPDSGGVTLYGQPLGVGSVVPAEHIAYLELLETPPQRKYRYQTEYLFQPIPTDFSPSQYGGTPYDWRGHGATALYVDNSSGWHWEHAGGDWIDMNGVPQGPTPWWQSSGPAVTIHAVDVTAMIQAATANNLWIAMLVKSTSPRVIAGARNEISPVIRVVYDDGTTEGLICRYSARMTTSTSYVQSTSTGHTLPAVLEFEKPTKPVVSATLKFATTGGSSGNATISGQLLNPPVNNDPVEYGLASGAGQFDDGLSAFPGVLGVHRYLDGIDRGEYISDCGLTVTSERDYSPHIWDPSQQPNTNLLPFIDCGKWIAAGPQHQLVNSDYEGDGFEPLAPGLGALRVEMPATPGVTNGTVIDSTGTTASIARIYLPDEHYGLLKRIFVRYYVRWGLPLDTSFAKRFEYRRYSSTGTPAWADMAGKWGITPSHTTRWGFSGSSGGGYGWQMRNSWALRNLEMGDPSGGGISVGLHTFDFGFNQPPGHKYGSSDRGKDKMFGQRGGLGGVMWPGHWYCVEMEVDLNTVMMDAPGWIADGSVNSWIDGRPAFKRSGMVMRSLPIQTPPYVASSTRPARELGHAYLDFNWYHGGTTENPVDMTLFVTGLAWGTEYIGPMRLQ